MGAGKPLDATDFANGNAIDMSLPNDKDPIEDAIENGNELFEGDIELSSAQVDIIEDGTDKDSFLQRAATKKRKWTKIQNIVPIPYVLSSSYTSSERATIARAFTEFETKTCIRYDKMNSERNVSNQNIFCIKKIVSLSCLCIYIKCH